MADTSQPKVNPLGESDLASINQALAHANAGLEQVSLAERAGLDVTQQRAQLEQAVKQLTKIKQVYFPAS